MNKSLENQYNELNNKYNSLIKENDENKNKITQYEMTLNEYKKEIDNIKLKNNEEKDLYGKTIKEVLSQKYEEILKQKLDKITNYYKEEFKKEEKEIKIYINKLSKQLLKNKKMMNLNFMTNDENIHYSIKCQKTNCFNEIIKNFFDKYPEYKKYENIYTIKGKKVDVNKSIEENNIHNNNIITIKCKCNILHHGY